MRAGLFPGQGLDARVIADALPVGHRLLARTNEILGYDVRRAVSATPRASLRTRVAQPAIMVAGLISYGRALRAGRSFDFLAGHSLGEYTALVASGAIRFREGLELVAARGLAMERAARSSPGGMAVVLGLGVTEVEELSDRVGAVVANDNSPTQVVVAGADDALAQLAAAVRSVGARCIRLPVEGPFHSAAMDKAQAALDEALTQTEIRLPRIPVVANMTAKPYRIPGEIRKLLAQQLTGRVRFRASIEWLVAAGVDDFEDLGPAEVVGKIAHATVLSSKAAIDA